MSRDIHWLQINTTKAIPTSCPQSHMKNLPPAKNIPIDVCCPPQGGRNCSVCSCRTLTVLLGSDLVSSQACPEGSRRVQHTPYSRTMFEVIRASGCKCNQNMAYNFSLKSTEWLWNCPKILFFFLSTKCDNRH